MNRKKLFEVMRWYGVHEKLVRLIERIYDGSIWWNLNWRKGRQVGMHHSDYAKYNKIMN